MKISVGSDHRGVQVKTTILKILDELGHSTNDQGTHSTESCDYPDYAHAVAQQVAGSKADRGILICGTGIGMSMAANKTPGIRAALCHHVSDAELSRRHNDANVLCLSADQIESFPQNHGETVLQDLISRWLDTDFDGGRHQRRVDKIASKDNAACDE